MAKGFSKEDFERGRKRHDVLREKVLKEQPEEYEKERELLNNTLYHTLDALDAEIMSSDALVDPDKRELLRGYLKRWYRVLIEHTALFHKSEAINNTMEVYSELANLAINFRAVGNETIAQKLDAMGDKLAGE